MMRLFRLALFLFAGWLGYTMSHTGSFLPLPRPSVFPDKEYPMVMKKSFVIVVYAHNQAAWCERSLRSIFEQEYDPYRVIFIDDGSVDKTFEIAQKFILENAQEEKVILIRNQQSIGPVECLYRAANTLLDQEIVIPLLAQNWFSQNGALTHLNAIYQNPDVWIASTSGLTYPFYETQERQLHSFYAPLFKKLKSSEGSFAQNKQSDLTPLFDLAGGRVRVEKEPLVFINRTL